ncbi:MAG: NUDIX hydrolase [Planctomycetes bacterium]|nr:NUDIX hydrolase [Planctomycetota bacterium]
MSATTKAIFGRPVTGVSNGGAHISVDVITLYKDKVVLFERPGLKPGGQDDLGDLWFPWDYLNYGEQPDAAAKRVLKQWGKAEGKTLRLVEVFSMVPPGEDWHLAFQYVADLKAAPKNGQDVKEVKLIEPNQLPRMVGFLRRSDIKRHLTIPPKA